jgi:hypothetical protein
MRKLKGELNTKSQTLFEEQERSNSLQSALLRRTNATLVSDKEPDLAIVNELVRGGGVIEAAELFELRAKLKEALKHNEKLLFEKKEVEDRQNEWIQEVEKIKTRNRELEFKTGGMD